MRIDEIKPYPKNAKKHPEKQIKQIAESIKEFGFNQPLVIDKNNEIVVGHGRYEAAKLIGLEEVPVIRVENLTEEQVKAYRLADNKLNESEWDMGLAIEELKGLSNEMVDLTGFDKDLLIEPDEKDDIIPENVSTRAKLGDVWQLGRHRVVCGDSTKKEDVERLMDGKKADMVFTDPPYNVDYEGGFDRQTMSKEKKKWGKIENDNMSPEAWANFTDGYLQQIVENCEGPVYIFMSCKELPIVQRRFVEFGGHWQSTCIWQKERFVFGMKDYKSEYEPFIYGWIKNRNWSGPQNLTDIWKVSRDRAKDYDHPTQKPVEIIQRAITNSSEKEYTILDLFLGSGSTLIAAEKTGRICYGMEIDPKYVDVIIQRWQDYTNKKAVKLK